MARSSADGDVVLGIDPGLGTTGWGVIRRTLSGPVYIDSGRIRTKPVQPTGQRLAIIFAELQRVAAEYHATLGAVESGFVGKSALSALQLGQARAAAVLALETKGIPVQMLAPREIKSAITGRGAAVKQQVSFMVGKLLRLEFDKGEEDISDALAAALCCLFQPRTHDAHRS